MTQAIHEAGAADEMLAELDRLRSTDPELAKQLITASFAIAVNAMHLIAVQDEISRRTSASN